MLKVDIKGDLTLRQQLKLLRLPKAKRRRFNKKLIRETVKFTRKRMRQQKGLDNQAWEKRKKGRAKMLRKIMRAKHLRVTANDKTGLVTWANKGIGGVARRHQEGVTQMFTAQEAAKEEAIEEGRSSAEADSQNAPATNRQAKELLEEGFRIYAGKRNGRVRTRRVSKRWIKQNMTRGRAGLILSILRDGPRKKSWEIRIPKRTFLGITKQEKRQLAETTLREMAQQAKRK